MDLPKLSKEQLKKTAGIFTLSALGLVGLSACAEHQSIDRERSVVVTNHEYDDPDTWITTMMVGKVPVIQTHFDREHFYLNVQQCGFDPKTNGTDEAGCTTASIEVDQTRYDQTADGAEIYLSQ